ncbi:MAG: AAA family ATPase [Campylobacterota bacterium]
MSQQKKIQTLKRSKKIIIALVALLGLLLSFAYLRDGAEHINASKAEFFIQNKPVTKAYIDGDYLYIQVDNENYKVIKDAINMQQLHQQVAVKIKQDKSYLMDLFLVLIILAALVMLLQSLRKDKQKQSEELKKMQVANPYEQPSIVKPQKSDVRFDDVAGIDDVKVELQEIIEFLKSPKKYQNFGIRMPRGVLLVGPPGVGKTMIAKAVAGEAKVPFFYQSGASFVQIYVGMGAKRVKELFAKAKMMSPSIIFIDEIDAVGKSRGANRNDERESTLNQLLTEMDGFEDSSEVIVVAATNRIEMLDDALLRPGRFDRRVHVGLPNAKERKTIAQVYLGNKPNSVDLDLVANLTIGFSGAAISSLVNEAAIHALNSGKKAISDSDIIAVKDKIISGKKRVLSLSQEEKKIQAIYQGAKALAASWFEVHFDKIGIINEHITGVEKEILSKNEMLNQVKVHLAGIIATKESYGESFSNAQADLKMLKQIIATMLENYGMSNSYGLQAHEEQLQIINECSDEIKTLLIKLRPLHQKIVSFLLQNEYITQKDIKELEDALL